MKRLFLVFTGCFLLLTGVVIAQDEPNPLLNLLSYVPNSPTAQSAEIVYSNLQALYPPFDALHGSDETDRSTALITRSSLGGEFFLRYLGRLPGVVEATGVSLPDVKTMLRYGMSPSTMLLLTGGYTVEAVNLAHENRDYVSRQIEDFTVWCGDADCDPNIRDESVQMDPVTLTTSSSNFFDNPPLRRKLPVAVSEDAILSGTDMALITGGIEAQKAGTGTLAQEANFAALANGLVNDAPGELVGAWLLPPGVIVNAFPDVTGDSAEAQLFDIFIFAPEDAVDKFIDQVKDYGDLPPFALAGIGDYFDGTQDVLVIALVYANQAQAQTAAEEAARRFSTYQGDVTYSVDEPLVETMHAVIETSVYHDEAAGRYVARITITYPLPAPVEGDALQPQSAGLYSLVLAGIVQRSLYPLWQIDLPESMLPD